LHVNRHNTQTRATGVGGISDTAEADDESFVPVAGLPICDVVCGVSPQHNRRGAKRRLPHSVGAGCLTVVSAVTKRDCFMKSIFSNFCI
jgi:hypothetical protein